MFIVFSSASHPLLKIPLKFYHLLMRSPAKFSSRYYHDPLKLRGKTERSD